MLVCAGVSVLGFGVSLIILANFGTDPYTCLNLGISGRLHISFGIWSSIINAAVLVFTFRFGRRMIGLGTIVNMTMVGILADVFRGLLKTVLPPALPMAGRITLLLAGLLVFGVGVGLYIAPDFGFSPYDSVAYLLTNATHLDFRLCRIFTDCLCVLAGWLLGSTVGVGTVLTAFCTGPFIRFFSGLFARRFLPGLSRTGVISKP